MSVERVIPDKDTEQMTSANTELNIAPVSIPLTDSFFSTVYCLLQGSGIPYFVHKVRL